MDAADLAEYGLLEGLAPTAAAEEAIRAYLHEDFMYLLWSVGGGRPVRRYAQRDY